MKTTVMCPGCGAIIPVCLVNRDEYADNAWLYASCMALLDVLVTQGLTTRESFLRRVPRYISEYDRWEAEWRDQILDDVGPEGTSDMGAPG